MIHQIFPIKDATIYEGTSSMNTGLDQILELDHNVSGGNTVSRILMQFDLTDVSASISAGTITNPRYYLVLNAMEGTEVQLDYTLEVYPVSESWDMGTGKKFNYPITTDAVNWTYRTSTDIWITGSYAIDSTGSYYTNPGGGSWYTIASGSQRFNYTSPDTRIDVTNIVNQWISGSIVNNGFIIKRPTTIELGTQSYGNLKFFSMDSHTIFLPKLQVAWDNQLFVTGSLSELTDESKVIYVKGLQKNLKVNSKTRVRVAGRSKYPTRTFATSSSYLDIKYLPTTSYYSIYDTVTDEVIIPFDDNYTKLSCDTNGNYFDLWATGFLPERYYKIVIKVIGDGTEDYYDNGNYFKVVR